jgi:hypothetical protein
MQTANDIYRQCCGKWSNKILLTKGLGKQAEDLYASRRATVTAFVCTSHRLRITLDRTSIATLHAYS